MANRSQPPLISINPNTTWRQQTNIHNRWHPDIPAVASVEPGDQFTIECHDFTGGLVRDNDTADDVAAFNWNQDHCLSGPIRVHGAKPGDVVAIDVLNIRPLPAQPWGFSFVKPGIGPLDSGVRVAKAIWDFHDNGTTASKQIADVSFAGRPHCGTIGTAPSAALLQQWTSRESSLNQRCVSHHQPCAQLPCADGAFVQQSPQLSAELLAEIQCHGARTTPARENGGNMDCRTLSRQSQIFLPVFVTGANLSVGDLHFSQGDGEPTCAIEMAGDITLRCTIIPGGMKRLDIDRPLIVPGPAETIHRPLAFHGLSIDPSGVQQKNDATAAYVNAAWRVIAWLAKFGYSLEQAIILLATAPITTRILAVANSPTVNVSIEVPTDIFHFEMQPSSVDPECRHRGELAYESKSSKVAARGFKL
ncbi:hypothetical protein FE257_002193 [Aspergillus nanangensis]|uniref:Formamidase n=1 Tax=Aspergillus nanangensis TaxID=2582783 RepID=A0AAD4GP78_ASPNN|nr:hypothetical protein FE257_002193 [Aspergillus nanangensis]